MTLLFVIFLLTVALMLAIGLYGIIVTRNLMRILMSVEILTKAVTLLMIGVGYETGKMGTAQSFVISIIVIEVMLLVIATGILYGVFKTGGSIMTTNLNNLKG
jgi:NADH:ubiquinone oxidoreductase subunit K